MMELLERVNASLVARSHGLLFIFFYFDYDMACYLVMQIPNWFGGEVPGATKDNPFSLPEAYMNSQHKNVCFDFSLIGSDFRLLLTFLLS